MIVSFQIFFLCHFVVIYRSVFSTHLENAMVYLISTFNRLKSIKNELFTQENCFYCHIKKKIGISIVNANGLLIKEHEKKKTESWVNQN